MSTITLANRNSFHLKFKKYALQFHLIIFSKDETTSKQTKVLYYVSPHLTFLLLTEKDHYFEFIILLHSIVKRINLAIFEYFIL